MSNIPTQNVYSSFNFWVEIDGLLAAGFSEVTGLESEIETEDYPEGGVNHFVHRFPKKMKISTLVLRRGMSDSGELWNWYNDAVSGQIKRKNGSIILNNLKGSEICRWNFFDAYPIKWSGPDFNATRNEIGIESLELTHNGIKAIF